MNIVQFLPGLYGGGALDEKGWVFIRKHVNVVINIREKPDHPPFPQGNLLLIHKPIANDEPPELPWVIEMTGNMQQWLHQGYALYVHDTAGKNRLGFLIAAYYMKQFGYSRDEALRIARQKKPDLKPNRSYMALLAKHEAYLWGRGLGPTH